MAIRGNPTSLHADGRFARRGVEEHRERLAAALGARPGDVVFTAGGTEADNLAVKGLYWARRQRRPPTHPRARQRSRAPRGARPGPVAGRARGRRASSWLPVDHLGRVSTTALEAERRRRPRLGRPGHGHVGQQRGRHGPAGRDHRSDRPRDYGVPLHSDAVQALGQHAGRLRVERAGRGQPVRAQARRPDGRRCAARAAATSTWCRCCTAAARSATSAPAPSTRPRSPGSRSRSSEPSPSRWRARGPRARLRDDLVRRVLAEVARRLAQRRPRPGRPAPRQRPHLVRRMRGRRPAHAARRARRVVLDRQRLLGRGAQPCHVLLAMGDDDARRRVAAVLPRSHLHPAGRGRAARASCPASSSRARTAGRLAARGA